MSTTTTSQTPATTPETSPSAASPAPKKRSIVRRVLLTLGLVVVVLVGGVLGLAATKPDEFRIERSLAIDAPPEAIYPLIADFHQWEAWSPFEKVDPNAKKSFSGADSGLGAKYAWEGNAQAGAGNIEVTSAEPPHRLTMDLNMVKPFECHNVVEFTLEPQGDATVVTWAMSGKSHYCAKIMQVFCDMDAMCGGQFEEGLAQMKSIAEKQK